MLFQLIAVPTIFAKMKLPVLTGITLAGILVIVICSVILNRKEILNYYKHQLEKVRTFKNTPYHSWMYLVTLLALGQTLFATFTWTGHEDDNRYVAAIVDAYETDDMLMYNPMTGEWLGEIKSELTKDAVAPILMFWGVFCKLLRIHPAIFTHIAVPLFMIPLCYGIFYLLADKLCKGDTRRTGMFMVVFWLFNVLNHDTPWENIGRMIYYMRWGKSILYVFSIPLLILLLIEWMEAEKPGRLYAYITVLLYGSCVASIMAPIFLPLITGAYALCDGVRTKSLKRMIQLLLCCGPALVYGILYFALNGR